MPSSRVRHGPSSPSTKHGRRELPARKGKVPRKIVPTETIADPRERLVQEMLELAFHRAAKVSVSGDTTLDRQRRLALRKIGRASGNLLRQLRIRTRPFSKDAALGPFRKALLDERWGKGGMERSLLRVRRAQERLIRLRTEEERKVPRLDERYDIAQAVRRYYGRSASLLREIAGDLIRLHEGERLLRDRPSLEGRATTVVVAGYPNVGKSSLLARLTRARPKIAAYPFTTVAVAVGHAPIGPLGRAQLVDTPGMLERDESERNPVEREAFLAVREGGPVIVFLLDPSGSCGWPIGDQEALLARLRQAFPDRVFVEVENKSDLARSSSPRLKISCTTGEGIEQLQERIGELLRDRSGGLPPLPPIRDEEFPPEDFGDT